MAVQILAGVLGAMTYSGMHHMKSFPLSAGGWTVKATGKELVFGYGGVAFCEIVFTFVLCYVVLCVATVKKPSEDMFGLAIASCVTAGGYAIGAVSGGSLNPAVSVG